MNTRIISIVFLFSLVFTTYSQQLNPPPNVVNEDWIQSQMDNPQYRLQTIQIKADSFFNYVDTNTVITKLEKHYKRWLYFWQSRITSPDDTTQGANFQLANSYYEKAQNNGYNFCTGGGNETPWEFYGPKQIDYAYMGRVDAVSVNPNNLNNIVVGTNKSGMWKTDNLGDTWVNVTDNMNLPSLGVFAITRNPNSPNILMACTGAASDESALYRYGVLRSFDYGSTWQVSNLTQTSGFDNDEIIEIKYSDLYNGHVAAISKNKLFFSSNNGSSWTVTEISNLSNNEHLVDIEFTPPRPDLSQTIYLSTYTINTNHTNGVHAKIFKVDYAVYSSGGSVNAIDITPPSSLVHFDFDDVASLDFSQLSNNSLYACIKTREHTPNPNDVENRFVNYLKYNINTNTWSFFNYCQMSSGSFNVLSCYGVNKHEFEVSNFNENVIFIGACTMNKSTDAGASFSQISEYYPGDDVGYTNNGHLSTHADIRAFKIFNVNTSTNEESLIMGHDGGVAYAETGNGTPVWNNINGEGLSCTQFYGFDKFTNANSVIGGTQDNGTLKNASNLWSHNGNGDGGYTRINDKNENIVYGIANSHLKKSINSGNSFSNLGTGNPDSYISSGQTKYHWYLGMKYELNPNNPDNLFFGVTRLYKFDGNTNTWSNPLYTLPPIPNVTNRIRDIEIDPTDSNIVYISCIDPTYGIGGLTNRFFKSTDGGNSFSDLTPNFPAYAWSFISEIEVDPNNPNIVYACMSQFWASQQNPNEGANRVLKSIDGGATWNDMSAGLGYFPVNTIEIVDGGDEEIYAGTDIGVFRWDKSLSKWRCMWDGMPKSIVSDLRIDYCERKLYASTFGRGIWSTDLQPSNGVIAEKEISTNTTIESGGYWFSSSSITVKPGVTFTVKGKLDMAEGTQINVKKGATLVVDGGIISNKCGKFWYGIQAFGNSNFSQFSGQQGRVIIRNNSTIEFAEEGVQNWRQNYFYETGGIIEASNSTFRNCKRSAAFYKYENYHNGTLLNDRSKFEDCSFIIDDEFPLNVPTGFISMWNTYGVKVFSCDFKDDRTNPIYYTPYGVKTIDAYTLVAGTCLSPGPIGSACTQFDNSTFENLVIGVDISNGATNNAARVTRCDFINNQTGVQLSAHDQAEVNFNNFTWNASRPSVFNDNIGIYLQNASGFQIEENDFIDNQASSNANNVGILSNNAGNDNNEIRKNNFEGLFIGNWAINQNRSVNYILPDGTPIADGTFGMEFLCNTYDNDNVTYGGYTQTVSSSNSGDANSGVKLTMGSSSNPSGNCHADDLIVGEDISNSTINSFTYNYFNFGTPCKIPVEIFGNVIISPSSDENECPSSFVSNPPVLLGSGISTNNVTMLRNTFNSSDIVFKNKLSLLNTEMNSYNTDSIINVLDNMQNNTKRKIYNDLMDASPYLSIEVLKEYALKHDHTNAGQNVNIPEPWVKNLILENIDAVKSYEFIDFLKTKPTPLSNNNIEDIEDAMMQFSTDRGTLELEVMEIAKVRSDAMHALIRHVQHDTIHSHFDTLRSMVTQYGDVLYKMNIIDTYLKEEDYESAMQEINAINPETYSGKIQKEIIDFMTLKSNMIYVLQEGRSIAELYKGEITNLKQFETIAQGRAKYQARNILCFFYNYCIDDYLPYPFSDEKKGKQKNADTQIDNIIEVPLKIYPNPASDELTVEWPSKTDKDQRIIITDINGRVILNQLLMGEISIWKWNTTNVADGIYVLQVKEDNQTKYVQKFNIVH